MLKIYKLINKAMKSPPCLTLSINVIKCDTAINQNHQRHNKTHKHTTSGLCYYLQFQFQVVIIEML